MDAANTLRLPSGDARRQHRDVHHGGNERDEHEEDAPHGLRSSFRDWAAELTDFPRAVVEAALAHRVADRVEAAYFRCDLFDRRRDLMQAWSDYLTPHTERAAP